jgi:hypothetical protein
MTRDDSGSPPWDVHLINENVRKWFQTGRSQGAKYLLICQDTFDLYDPDMGLYPHYSNTGDEARRFSAAQLTGIDLLVKVLDLAQDLEVQLSGPIKQNLDALE